MFENPSNFQSNPPATDTDPNSYTDHNSLHLSKKKNYPREIASNTAILTNTEFNYLWPTDAKVKCILARRQAGTTLYLEAG